MEIANITVLVPYYRTAELVTNEIVPFRVFKEKDNFKAIPLIPKEERRLAGLPEEMNFGYADHSIISSKELAVEANNAVKKIIIELRMQRLM